MRDMCISLNDVKPGFLPAAVALNRNGDGKVCKSENPRISDAEFEAFVNTVRAVPKVNNIPGTQAPEMVKIPAGVFSMGSDDVEGDQKPIRRVSISAFALGKFEVTNGEYKPFADRGRVGIRCPGRPPDRPCSGVLLPRNWLPPCRGLKIVTPCLDWPLPSIRSLDFARDY